MRLKLTPKNLRAAALLAFLICILGFEYHYSDRFYPNTYIGDVSVGGMTYREASDRITPALEDAMKNGVDLQFTRETKSRLINIPASVTGFTADTVVEYFSVGNLDDALQAAYQRGREASLADRLLSKTSSLFLKKTVQLPHSVQKEAVFSLLDRELNGFLKGPQNAEFIESNGEIAVQDGKPGAQLNFTEVTDAMDKALSSANTDNLKFQVKLTDPPLTAESLKPMLDFAENLDNSVNVEFWNGINWWRARGPILATWLTLNPAGKNSIDIDGDKLKNYFLTNVDTSIDGTVENSRFQMINGKLVEIVPGKSGLDVNLDEVKIKLQKELQRKYQEYQSGKINPETLSVNFDIKKVAPKITKETIDQYQIRDLVGRAVVSFAGSHEARIHNIKTGISKINGMLIAPGEEFSAAIAIGLVNEEAGYLKELVIKDNATVKEYGGGLCQIATTLFRAAMNTGLPITERQNHSYVVSYYGPGLDATIYGPHPDLRFINNTGNYLLLQGYTEGTNSIFEFYGKKDGRNVTISKPAISDIIPPPDTRYIMSPDLAPGETHCTERRNNGLTASVDYRVEYADSSVSTQTFTSKYVPWQQVCLLGAHR